MAIIKLLIYIAIFIVIGFYILWNLLTFFRPINSTIKFFQALGLFIKDLWNENLHTFRGYRFWLFAGIGGKGNTLSMLEYAYRMKCKYPLLRVYTTFDCEFADGRINSWEDLKDIQNFTLVPVSYEIYNTLKPFYAFEIKKENGEIRYYKKVHQGIIFLFDEIHFTFNSRNWKKCPAGALEQISQNRKYKKLILGTSQSYDRIDVILREQSNFVVDCNNLFWGRFVMCKFYDRKMYEAMQNHIVDSKGRKIRIKPKKKYCFVGTDFIREQYDTTELQKDINNTVTSSDLIAQGVLQAIKQLND